MDMSRVIPSDAYLETLTIATTTPDTSAAVTEPLATPATAFVATLNSTGKGLTVETLST